MNSRVSLEAKKFVQKYNPEGLVPFPFDDTVLNLGNVDIVNLKLQSDVSGAIFFQDDRFKIVVDPDKPSVRQYFTLAHEFGHYVLHKDWLISHPSDGFIDRSINFDNLSALMRPDSPPLSPEEVIREKEANNFAAEILMPSDKVEEFWKLTEDIAECANAFQVSVSAMAIRLERLGLV